MLDILNRLDSYLGLTPPKKSVPLPKVNSSGDSSGEVWRKLSSDILATKNMTKWRLSKELEISIDSLERMQRGLTAQPRYPVLTRLFVLHMMYCPQAYGQRPLLREWVVKQGWQAGS